MLGTMPLASCSSPTPSTLGLDPDHHLAGRLRGGDRGHQRQPRAVRLHRLLHRRLKVAGQVVSRRGRSGLLRTWSDVGPLFVRTSLRSRRLAQDVRHAGFASFSNVVRRGRRPWRSPWTGPAGAGAPNAEGAIEPSGLPASLPAGGGSAGMADEFEAAGPLDVVEDRVAPARPTSGASRSRLGSTEQGRWTTRSWSASSR